MRPIGAVSQAARIVMPTVVWTAAQVIAPTVVAAT